jgi:hypothetical protein
MHMIPHGVTIIYLYLPYITEWGICLQNVLTFRICRRIFSIQPVALMHFYRMVIIVVSFCEVWQGSSWDKYVSEFKVCKSVHHCTIQINHQPDAIIFHFIILTFIYSSTCFGRFPAHHQELNDCSGSLWFYLRIVVIVALCWWSGDIQCAMPNIIKSMVTMLQSKLQLHSFLTTYIMLCVKNL